MDSAPFGSFVDYVLDDLGYPVFLINEMSMHSRFITAALDEGERSGSGSESESEEFNRNRTLVTLFTKQDLMPGKKGRNYQTSSTTASKTPGQKHQPSALPSLQSVARCSITGYISPIDPTSQDLQKLKAKYFLTHSYAIQVSESSKFKYYRLTPTKIYFVGGFGVGSKWIDVDDYVNAKADVLASSSRDIIEKVNVEHTKDLVNVAEGLLGVGNLQNVVLTSVDRYGVDLRVSYKTLVGMVGGVGGSDDEIMLGDLKTDEYRIGFRKGIVSVENAKSEILKIFHEAWERGGGDSGVGIGGGFQDEDDGTFDEDEALDSPLPVFKIAADSLRG